MWQQTCCFGRVHIFGRVAFYGVSALARFAACGLVPIGALDRQTPSDINLVVGGVVGGSSSRVEVAHFALDQR